MSSDEFPQSDQVDGVPHPRDTAVLIGQQTAEATFLEAVNSNRLHHAWLITGPQGIGKATLAWKIARFLLATPTQDSDNLIGVAAAENLDIPAEHPISTRISALSDPGLYLLRRAWDAEKKRFKARIGVEDIRAMASFFSLTNTEGGRRVVILDAADDMNVNAANALLKVLEEPPADAVLLLISHRPSGLLPTIRSRCRVLRCHPLSDHDMHAALQATGTEVQANVSTLASGSVGDALRLIHGDGIALFTSLLTLAESFPRMDRPTALKLAETVAARGAEAKFDLLEYLVELFLARLSKAGLGVPVAPVTEAEPALFARLAPDAYAARAWAELSATALPRLRHGRAVNLDGPSLILDMLLSMNQIAADRAA